MTQLHRSSISSASLNIVQLQNVADQKTGYDRIAGLAPPLLVQKTPRSSLALKARVIERL